MDLNGTATDTLNGMSVLTEEDQVRKAQEEFLAQQAQAAQQAQQQAQQSYQQLAQAPPPQLSPADTFLPTLIGNIASTIAQDPGYRQRAETGIQQSRAAMLKQRADNLTSQRDVWNQRAEEAKAAGDLEAREKYHNKIASLDKQLELVMANQGRAQARDDAVAARKAAQENALALEATRQKNRLELQRNTAQGKTTAVATQLPVRTTVSGIKWRDVTGLTGEARNQAILDSGAKGLPYVMGPEATTLKEIQVARINANKLRTFIKDVLPPNWQSRPEYIAKNSWGRFLQSNKKAAAFGAWRESAITQLKAAAAVTGNRQAQKQFEQVLKNDIPQFGDDIPTALERLDIVDQMLGSREDTILKPDLSSLNPEVASGQFTVKAPNGTTYSFPSQEKADIFKKRAGLP